MSGNRLEKQNFVEKQQLTTAGEQIVHEEILDDLQQNETDLVVTTTEKNTGKLQVDVLNNPIKIVKQSMSDPTESLPAGITLGEMKDASGTVTHLAFIDATGSAQGNSVIDVEQLNNEIAASGSPIIKEFTLGGQIYRCSYTISSETLSVSIDMIDAFEQLPVKIGSGPVIPNAKNFETAKPNTQEYWLVHNGTIAYPSALYQRITKANQVGKRVPQQRADMISLGVTKAELASSAPVEKIGTVTLPDTGEIRRYKAIYTVVDGKLTVTLTEASIELQPNEVILQHIPQIRNGIDETQLTVGLDQAKQLLTIDYAGKSTTLDLKNYPTWNTYGTITTLQPTDLPKIPMADGRILRLGVTLERTVDGKLNIRTRETPVAHETIQFADSVGNPTQTPMGKTLRRLKTDGAGMYREITDTSRYGGVLARLPVASEDFDHTPGTIRSLHTSPLFINGKTYEPVLGVDAGGTHLLQLRHIEGARGLIKGVNPFIQYGGGEPQAGAREIQAISEGSISKWTPDDPKNRAALDTFFMTNNRTITVQYRSPDGTLVPITLEYGFEDVYNKGILGKNSVFRQKTLSIDGKKVDLQFRLALKNGYLQMIVDNVTKREDIKLPEILQDPKDSYTNFLREELVYGKTTVKGYFNQLNGPASLTADRETKFKKLYPSQQNVAGIPFNNSKITIFRTDEFKPLNIENPLELGDDDSLFSFDLDDIPVDKWNRMKPVINADGSRNAGEKYTFSPKVADRGTLGFRPPRYNNETRPTEVTLEPIWGNPEIVIDDKGDFDPRNDVQIAKRPLLGYATRIKVLVPDTSAYREADREIDRDYIEAKAKEMGISTLEVIENIWGVGAAFLGPIREKIKEKARSVINMIPDPEVGKKQKFVDIAELQKLDMAWPLPGYKYQLQASADHENIPEFMGSTDFGRRYVGEYKDRIDFHPALDIGGLGGKHPPVVAALGGTVKYGGSSISILHDEQVVVGGKKYNIQTNYIHVDMSKSIVSDGAKVTKGQKITTVADDHLHFEVALIDPSTGKAAVFDYPPPEKIPSKYASLPLDTQDNPTNCINPAWFFDPGKSGAEHDFYGKLPKGFEVGQTAPSETAEKIQQHADVFVQEMGEWTKQKGGNYAKAYEILQKMHLHGEDLAITGIESNYGHPTKLKNPNSNARGPFQVLAGTSQNGFHTDLIGNGGTRPYNTDLLGKYVEKPPYTRLQDKEDTIYTALDTGTMIGMSVVYAKIYDLLQTKSEEINGKKFDSYRGSLRSRKEDVKKRLETVGIKTFDDKIFDDLTEQIRTEEEYYTRWKVRCKYGAEEMTGYTEPFRATHALTVMYLAKIQNSLPPQDNGGGGSGGSASGETTKTEEEKRLEEELNKNKKKKTPENIDPSALVGLSMAEYKQGLAAKETQGFGNGIALPIGGKNVYYYDPKVAKGTGIQGGTKVLYKNTNNKDTTGFYLLKKETPYVTFMFKAHEMTTPTEITVDNKKISRKITTEDITDTNGNITAANQPVVTFMTGK